MKPTLSAVFERSLQSVTDKRGLQTAYLYDAYGNLTNAVTTGDLTGNGIPTQTATNTASYNANNLPVQVTDPVGNGTVVVYDPTFTFLPQQVIRYAGATAVSTNFQIYANVTNVVVNGSLTQTNLAFGVMTRGFGLTVRRTRPPTIRLTTVRALSQVPLDLREPATRT